MLGGGLQDALWAGLLIGRRNAIRIDLASTRLAFVLIALLVVHVLAAAVIPQAGISQDQFLDLAPRDGVATRAIGFLRLDRIYTSWPFHVLLGLLLVNLAAGNVRRFRQLYHVERTLFRLRYLGSIVFHLALMAILLGAIGNYLFKFQGVFALTEGQTAADDPDGYFRVFPGPLAGPPPGEFRLTVEEIDPEWEQGSVTTAAARLRLESRDGPPAAETVRLGHPIAVGDREIHLGARSGFSPEVLLLDPTGSPSFRSFVRLAVSKHGEETVHSDFIEPVRGLTLRLEVHDPESAAPRPWVAVVRGDSTLFEGYVADADTVAVGEWRLAVPRMRRWAFVEVLGNPGLGVIFAGFWTALGGLTLTFVARVRGGRRKDSRS